MTLAIFAIIALGVLGAYAALTKSVKVAREKTILAALADSNMEIVKNMPYSQVGTITGNPNGTLPDASNPIVTKIESYTYKIYYRVRYIDDPADGLAPADSEPADYKQVKMEVLNTTTGQLSSFVTNIVPKGLEGTINAGALLIKVINAAGQPVVGANVHIESTTTAPSIILDDVTGGDGQVIEVGLPARVNGYHIVASKAGYTTDQTYPITASNPNPIKPDATIVDGTVTSVSLAIDLVSTLNIYTLNNLCQGIDGVNVNVKGAKLIGLNPDVLKYDHSFASVAGLIGLNNLEWDTYTPTLLSGQSWVVMGTSPIQKIDVLPGTTQNYNIILSANSTANSLLVIVKDAATGASLEGATVHLQKGGSTPQDYYGTTGGSVWVQQDWTAGPGVSDWSTTTTDSYLQDDANVDINSVPTGVRLKKITGRYVLSGLLESSSFDTGTSNTNYSILTWEPPSQSASTTVAFQLAANNDNGTWNYVGPDGTSATYYTVPGSDISNVLDNNRYVRYKMFLSTDNDKKTPVVTSVSVNYVSGCATPGQYWFGDLTSGNNYTLTVSMPGYTDFVKDFSDIFGNQLIEVLMSP